MKVYRVGTKFIDLDQVQVIGEPYIDTRECCNSMVIPLTLILSGETKIKVAIDIVEFKGEMFKPVPEGSHYLSFSLPLSYTAEFKQYLDNEFTRMKYNVWKPFLDAWQEKDKSEISNNLK